MITYLRCERGFPETGEWCPGCWLNVDQPTTGEIDDLKTRFGVPEDFLNDISDIDERPRVERNDGWICTIFRIPVACEDQDVPFTTVPVGVMANGEYIITACYYANNVLSDFIDHAQKRSIGVNTAVDFMLRLLNSSAYWFLRYLKDVRDKVADAEGDLRESVRNEDLFRLMNLQKSFVLFATSISGNHLLLDRINRLYRNELDHELFDDVSIEFRQADATATIATQMLDRTLDTYASVISNNVNAIMKRLTSISLIMMIPTLIASFYGMNVDVGFSIDNHWAFGCIIGAGLTLSVISCIVLRKIKWL
ncbi:MAG: magnesium transporter CorA family protein [Bacteroidales bacterium]|nr:magnesium transporter CorA family protein [Bacteroidales bacterium]